jgi:serine/threonine-protein kinase
LDHKRRLAAKEIRVKPEAETSQLEKEKPKVAAIPKEVPIRRVSLRKKPKEIGLIKLTDMLLEYDFFERSKNTKGAFVNDFVDNNDGTVTDKATGLMWQKSGSSSSLENRGAKEYIKQLNRKRFAGHSDWRMPTVEELASLLAKSSKSGAHINSVFDHKRSLCWTADKDDAFQEAHWRVWVVDFKNGQILQASFYARSKTSFYGWYAKNEINYVKAVRSVR